jgi:hypothetical protein
VGVIRVRGKEKRKIIFFTDDFLSKKEENEHQEALIFDLLLLDVVLCVSPALRTASAFLPHTYR